MRKLELLRVEEVVGDTEKSSSTYANGEKGPELADKRNQG